MACKIRSLKNQQSGSESASPASSGACIVKDMYKYAREFRSDVIPHITEAGEIVDIIHNYKRPKMTDNSKKPPVAPDASKGGAD